MTTNVTRVFLTYAAKDANYRSILLAATKAARLPVHFVEMPNHVTDSRSRRVLCRAKLQQCDAALVLLSHHALGSTLVESDIECVHEGDLPLQAVVAGPVRGTFPVPLEWRVAGVMPWSWPQLAAFLQQPYAFAPSPALAAG